MLVAVRAIALGLALIISGCGRDTGTRATTGGLLGTGGGVALGVATGGIGPAVGALVGGGVGAAGGAATFQARNTAKPCHGAARNARADREHQSDRSVALVGFPYRCARGKNFLRSATALGASRQFAAPAGPERDRQTVGPTGLGGADCTSRRQTLSLCTPGLCSYYVLAALARRGPPHTRLWWRE